VLVGLSLNQSIKNLELNLSMSALGTGGSQVLECLIANIRCIGSLDISDNGQSVADGFVFTYLLNSSLT